MPKHFRYFCSIVVELCNNNNHMWFFIALTLILSDLSEAVVFNSSHGTWQMLQHENPCLIPIQMTNPIMC